MHKLIERVYFKSPIIVQNMMLSLYGIKIWNQRYTGNHDSYLRAIRELEKCTKNEIEDYQNIVFLRFLKHAFENVPFYKKMQEEGVCDLKSIRSVADINKLPIIDKEMVRIAPLDFCATNYVKRNHFIIKTSGSTNKPLDVYCDHDSRRKHYAFWSRLRETHNVYKEKRATFFGKIVVDSTEYRPPFWRYDAVGKNMLFSSYHMSDKTMISYCDALNKLRPLEIIGYPSSLYILAHFIIKNRIEVSPPRIIFTTAESLSMRQREVIQNAFKAKVINQYGCVEMVVFAFECKCGNMHVHPAHGLLEVLNKEGEKSNEGEAVCTGFVNCTMPLIRYRLGDILKVSESGCDCGMNSMIIERIDGRRDDVFYTPSGNMIGRLNTILCGIEWLKEAQFVQNDIEEICVNYVAERVVTERDIKGFEYEIRKRVGPEMRIKFCEQTSIVRGPNGKFRPAICNLSRGEEYGRARGSS